MSIASYTTYHHSEYITTSIHVLETPVLRIFQLIIFQPLLHCIFARYTNLRKLVGKWGLKPHKAVLFHSLQFNQNRHRPKTNPQLNFLQAKYRTKKMQDCGKHLQQQAHQQPTSCICIIINLICQV